MTTHKGWYSRGYLPHWDQPGVVQAVTFHLADSLPLHLLNPGRVPEDEQAAQRARVQHVLDSGWGGCVLADPRVAAVVEDSLLFGDGSRYVLLA